MTYYFISISLVLHLASIFAIVVLSKKIDAFKPLDKEQTIEEIEGVLLAYTEEIKANNEELITRLKNQKNLSSSLPKEKEKKEEPQKNGSSFEVFAEKSSEKEELEWDFPLPEQDAAVIESLSDEAKIMRLYDEGKNAREIAKLLNLGAGEVDLFLRLNKKN